MPSDDFTYEKCFRCNGTGKRVCPRCDGKGSTMGPKRFLVGITLHRSFGMKRCDLCHGDGRSGSCFYCENGWIRKSTTTE